MARKLTGIRRHGNKWQALVRVNGDLQTKTFELTELEAAVAWREAQQQPAAPSGSFAAKVAEYLAQNQSKASIDQAAAHLELWLAALGRDRAPRTITKDEINFVLDDWLRTLKPGTVRKRRMWLRQFFVFLTGTGGPCQHATNPKEPKAGARGIDYLIIEKALGSMPARRSAKRGTLGPLSLALIRARVMIYTGLPPKLLKAVTADDLDFRAAKLYVHGRTKGDGVEERELSLGPEALAAFKAYHAAYAYGDGWSVSSMGRSVKAAFKRVGYTRHVRLYDLRHSYLTQVYRITRDTATVARLGMHAEGSPITARYTKGANQEVDEAAVAAFSQVLTERLRGAIKPAVSPLPSTIRARA
jgi:integrase